MKPKKTKLHTQNIIAHRCKSDADLLAQSTTSLQEQSKEFQAIFDAASRFISNSKNFIIDRIVMQILVAYGLRISEAISIQAQDISTDGTILIRSKKGSQPRLISGLQFSKWLADNRLFFSSQVRYRNRWYYYRLFKRLGIYKKMTGNMNNSTTHVFRYAFVQKVQAMTKEIETTGKIIGHVNKKNTENYGKKIK